MPPSPFSPWVCRKKYAAAPAETTKSTPRTPGRIHDREEREEYEAASGAMKTFGSDEVIGWIFDSKGLTSVFVSGFAFAIGFTPKTGSFLGLKISRVTGEEPPVTAVGALMAGFAAEDIAGEDTEAAAIGAAAGWETAGCADEGPRASFTSASGQPLVTRVLLIASLGTPNWICCFIYSASCGLTML